MAPQNYRQKPNFFAFEGARNKAKFPHLCLKIKFKFKLRARAFTTHFQDDAPGGRISTFQAGDGHDSCCAEALEQQFQ